MERKFIFQDGMDLGDQDFNDVQAFVQTSIDHAVADGISADRKFAGFDAAATSATEVTLEAGRLYVGGVVYARDEPFSRSFTTLLPVATKKNILIVAFGQEIDTASVPREFLINEENGASEPRVVATEHARICNLNIASGVEGSDPVDPNIGDNVLAIARVVLSPAGILAVEMIADNKLDSVQSVSDRVDEVELFVAQTGPSLVAITSDIAGMKANAGGLVTQTQYGRSLARLATLEAKAGIPDNAADSFTDFFLTADNVDLAFAGSNTKIQEGIRFSDQAVATGTLAIANTFDPAAKVVGNVLFPAYTRVLRMAVGPRTGEVQANATTFTTNELVQQTVSRSRIRYGDPFTVCTNAGWWGAQEGQYVPATFSHDGETFQTLGTEWDGPSHGYTRVQAIWEDSWEETYWSAVTVTHTVPGSQIAETFLNANDMILDAVGLTFTRLANTGDVVLAICETDRGAPDLSRVISYTTIARADMTTAGETVVPIQPTYLHGGRRYAIVIVTAASHWLATTGGDNYPQGTFFTVVDGAYMQGDGARDLVFSLYAAKFSSSRAVINLGPLSLDGGIAAIDILADTIKPASTDLTYEVMVNSVWYPLSRATASVLGLGGSIPPLVPLRAVFTGTPDVHAGVRLNNSVVKVSRPNVTLTAVSKVRSLPGAGSNQIRVITRYESFDPAHHTASCKLRTGAGFNTLVNPSSYVDVAIEPGTVERTWIFNLGAAVTDYRKQFGATTDSALNTFHHAWTKDYAL